MLLQQLQFLPSRHFGHGNLPIFQKVLHIGREDMQVPADGDVHAGGGGLRALVADVPGLLVVGRKDHPAEKKTLFSNNCIYR